ncbi:MAG: sulfite exporter TauE/SafE family protein [Methanospirillum sp.]
MITADPLLVYIAALLLVGAVVGVMAGLFGVGGGFLMVPAQFWALGLLGVDSETALRIAFGTSLAVVIPTAASSAWAHHCRRCVRWDAVRWIGPSAAFASLAGALLSTRVPGRPLELLLGLVLCAAAVQLLLQRASCDLGGEERALTRGGYLALGLPGGLLSGLLGIGGGIVLVPLLTLVLRYPVRTAVGTSTPVILCAALGGVVGYALTVPAAVNTLFGSIGYVNLPSAAALAIGSVPMAQLGARLAHACPPRLLRTALAAVMVFVGLLMLDVPRLLGI